MRLEVNRRSKGDFVMGLPAWSQSVFPVSVSSDQCTLTAFACVTACMYEKFIHSLRSHPVFIGYVSSGQCTLTASRHVVRLCTPHVHKHCPTTFS